MRVASEFDIAACNRKVSYPNRRIARRAAKQVLAQHGQRLAMYACPVCKRIHLAKQVPAHRRAQFRRTLERQAESAESE